MHIFKNCIKHLLRNSIRWLIYIAVKPYMNIHCTCVVLILILYIQDSVYAVMITELCWEFNQFIWWMLHDTNLPWIHLSTSTIVMWYYSACKLIFIVSSHRRPYIAVLLRRMQTACSVISILWSHTQHLGMLEQKTSLNDLYSPRVGPGCV